MKTVANKVIKDIQGEPIEYAETDGSKRTLMFSDIARVHLGSIQQKGDKALRAFKIAIEMLHDKTHFELEDADFKVLKDDLADKERFLFQPATIIYAQVHEVLENAADTPKET